MAMENVQERSPIKAISIKTAKIAGVWALTSFVVIKSGMIETLTRDPIDIHPDITDCTPTDQADIDEVTARLQEAAENVPDENSTPEDFGLTTLEPAVEDELYAITEPQPAVEYLNSVTTELYGFSTTTEKPNDPQTLEDARVLTRSLSKLPIELVAAAEISEVRLNADMPGNDAANYKVSTEVISIGSEFGESFGHELGHAFGKQWAEQNCEFSNLSIDPNFIAANPEGFQYNENYDGNDALVEEATIESYGGTAVEEDVATIFDELTASRSNYRSCPYYEESDIVNEKFAITIARIEEAVPGAGVFYIANLTERTCPISLIDGE